EPVHDSDMFFRLAVAAVIWCYFAESRKLRGTSSSYKRFYRERKSFLCIDGSKVIPFEQVNDDYCDCEDGSDEPGTSACPHGRFYCTNLGFRPHYIPSSRVNDGICDCCDASDEYSSPANCQNTCWNLRQRERVSVEDQMRTLDQGLQLKQQLIEEGVLLRREKQVQLRELQQAAEDLQVKLEEQRRRKHEAERLKEHMLRALGFLKNTTHTAVNYVLFVFFHSITVDEIQAKVALIHDEEWVLSKDEAVALLAGDHQMDLKKFHHTLWEILSKGDSIKVGSLILYYHFGSVLNANGCALIDVFFSLSDLQKKLAINYGSDWEFLFLNNQCYKLKVYEYTYSLCPFNQVTQTSSSGEEFLLGKWGMWTGTAEDQYSQMLYENGKPCWQGGSRSTTVTLTCGTETALQSVKEPSKCQYIMNFQTPAACQPVPKQRGVHSEL
uniref:Glucosidase 2 subunit beta n=1 Tax=Mola mola TaxID=94237 RepID=A0A3Q3WTJ6_MOLML